MISFLFGLKDIGRILNTGMRELVFSISSLIYQIVIMFYEIFESLCGSRLFDNTLLQTFIDRISVILGIVMLFIVIFSFIKMLVDPDKINDKEFGATSIIKKVIVVIIMLGMSSFAFNALYYVQDVVIEEDIISKILLPMRIDEENSDKFGNVLASGLFMSFYQLDTEVVEQAGETENVTYCNNITNQLGNQIMSNGNFSLGRECLTQTEKIEIDGEQVETFVVDYNYLLSLITGCIVGYLLFSYCISVGIRMIQLLFLEIISPMAIVSYLMPKKDTMLGKWGKIYISTYVDVFIRIAIIDFIIFIIASIFTRSNVIFDLTNFTGFSRSVVLAIIIIALLTFAKKAPDLLKELLPGSPSKLGFGMHSPKQIFDGMLGGNVVKAGAKMATVGAAIGLGSAALSGMSRYKINMKNGKSRTDALLGAAGGSVMAFGRGLKAGATYKGNVFKSIGDGINSQRTIDDKYDKLITSGGSVPGKLGSQISSHYGETKGQEYTRKIKNNQDFVNAYNNIDNLAESFLEVKIAKGLWQNAQARGESNEKIQQFFDNYKTVKKNMITSSINKNTEFINSVYNEKTGKFEKETKTMDVKSQAVSSQIQVDFQDISNLIKDGFVELSYKTKDKGTVIINASTLKDLNNADALDKASAAAANKIAEIKQTDGYSAAIANDKAAGVDSNATANKK